MSNITKDGENPYKSIIKISDNVKIEKTSRVHPKHGIAYHKLKIVNSENGHNSLKAIVERHYKDAKQATVIDSHYELETTLSSNGFEEKKRFFLNDLNYFLSKGLVSEDDPFYEVVDNPISIARKRFRETIKYMRKHLGDIELDIYVKEVERKAKPIMFWVHKKSKKADKNSPEPETN